MAYMSTETVRDIRNNLKNKFPAKKGYKFSVRRSSGHSGVNITVLKAPLQLAFGNAYYEAYVKNCNGRSNTYPKEHLDFFLSIRSCIFDAAGVQVDKSDSMTDYFNINYYYNIFVGEYDKPFVCTKPVEFDADVPNIENMEMNEDIIIKFNNDQFQFSRWEISRVTLMYGEDEQRYVDPYTRPDKIKTVMYQMYLKNMENDTPIVTISTPSENVPVPTMPTAPDLSAPSMNDEFVGAR